MFHFICESCAEPCQVLHHTEIWITREIEVTESKGWGYSPNETTTIRKNVNERKRRSYCRPCYDSIVRMAA